LLRHRILGGIAALGVTLVGARASADEAPVATITVTSATSGSSLGKLVEGVMRYRDRQYVLVLRGVAQATTSRGSVFGMQRPKEIEGIFRPVGGVLRNSSGVTIRFEPALSLEKNALEIEISGGLQPKISRGQPDSGVE
jgi:hypothetical protein